MSRVFSNGDEVKIEPTFPYGIQKVTRSYHDSFRVESVPLFPLDYESPHYTITLHAKGYCGVGDYVMVFPADAKDTWHIGVVAGMADGLITLTINSAGEKVTLKLIDGDNHANVVMLKTADTDHD